MLLVGIDTLPRRAEDLPTLIVAGVAALARAFDRHHATTLVLTTERISRVLGDGAVGGVERSCQDFQLGAAGVRDRRKQQLFQIQPDALVRQHYFAVDFAPVKQPGLLTPAPSPHHHR